MDWAKKNRVRIGGVAVLVVIAIAIAVVSGGGGGDDSKTQSNGAEIVDANTLRETAASNGTPIYWAGERPGAELELSQADGGQTYVRYLTGEAEAGDPKPDFLTIGTYKQPNAVAALRRQGHSPDGVLGKAPGGATVYFSRTQPHSVYLAYPGVGVEIEVYDPNFKLALRLVDSGQIVSVG